MTDSKLQAEEYSNQNQAVRIRILGFAGSLRQGSYNKLLLKAAAKLLPTYAQLEIFDLNEIPLYNQDLEALAFPETVKVFKQKIEAADALLIATPEYNHSYPGVLKNAIDWASRPYGQNSLSGKPAGVISSSPGVFGGIRAQDRLRQDLLAINARVVPIPEVAVGAANQKFENDGNLLDSTAQQFLKQLLANLIEEANRNNIYKQTFVAPALRPLIVARRRSQV